MKSLRDEFWKRVRKTDNHWEWAGSISPLLYGILTCNGDQFLAHRLSWSFEHGPVPEGLQVFNTCGIRHCVKPEHLKLEDPRQHGIGKYRYPAHLKGKKKALVRA